MLHRQTNKKNPNKSESSGEFSDGKGEERAASADCKLGVSNTRFSNGST
jgi:hypothetical protein